MAAEGVDIQAVSCVPFLMYPEVTPALGLAIAQVNNDALAAIDTRYPQHFAPLASVPCKILQRQQKNWNVQISWDSVVSRFHQILGTRSR